MNKCPFYNSYSACTTHPDCLFLRKGGCAIVLAPQIAEQNQQEIKNLQSQLSNIEYLLNDLINRLH
jgi:hypothetical protein